MTIMEVSDDDNPEPIFYGKVGTGDTLVEWAKEMTALSSSKTTASSTGS
jgi:hypothetical protein